MIVTPGDQFLLTASKDGSLLIWKITDPEGRKLEMVKCLDYSEEVLCTKAYLEETVNMTMCKYIWGGVETDEIMFHL